MTRLCYIVYVNLVTVSSYPGHHIVRNHDLSAMKSTCLFCGIPVPAMTGRGKDGKGYSPRIRVIVPTQSGWWFQAWFLFSISYMGCHPSHWLSYFSEGWLNNQPAVYWRLLWPIIKIPINRTVQRLTIHSAATCYIGELGTSVMPALRKDEGHACSSKS